MTVRSRSLLAAALGLWMAHPLAAGEPARLGVAPEPAATLAPSPSQRMADTIADHLRRSGQLNHYQVDVTYQHGIAALTGTVADPSQREEVLRTVRNVPGVAGVRDNLRVTGGPVTLAQAVEQPPFQAPPPSPVPNGGAEPAPMYRANGVPYDLNPPRLPPYAWPTYAPYNNFSRVAYPVLYPYNSWPFIGPMYPFPKVPLGWRSVKLEWDDGYWWYSKTASGYDWWRVRFW